MPTVVRLYISDDSSLLSAQVYLASTRLERSLAVQNVLAFTFKQPA